MKQWEKEIIQSEVQAIQKAGFRVFLSKKGNYGFFTDCKRVISFDLDFFTVQFSGNYTPPSKECGTGWRLEEGLTYQQMLNSYPPPWIKTHEVKNFRLSSPKDYLKNYQKSSLFKEVKL